MRVLDSDIHAPADLTNDYLNYLMRAPIDRSAGVCLQLVRGVFDLFAN